MMLQPLPKQVLRSCKKLCLARQRKLKELWLMPTKSMLSENEPWQSAFTPSRLLLKVSIFRLVFYFQLLLYWCTLLIPVFICCAGFSEVSLSSLPMDDDPLMDAVNLLEAHWISIQGTFKLVSRILSRLFTLLWPKRKAAMPKENLTELVKSFDTVEEPTLHFKALSIKRGAEGAIALSLAHGMDFDWGKVSSPHGHTCDEMKVFFEKAKKLAPTLLNTISPSAASVVLAATPAVAEDPVPPSTSGKDVVAPSSAMEHNAEVV
jgi:hypothetical protein